MRAAPAVIREYQPEPEACAEAVRVLLSATSVKKAARPEALSEAKESDGRPTHRILPQA